MKLGTLLLLTFVNLAVASENFSLKYTCADLQDSQRIMNLFVQELAPVADSEARILPEVVFTDSTDYVLELTNNLSHFKIKAKDEDQFITEKNKIPLGEETSGLASLQLNDELILKHTIELPVDSCAGEYTEENCFIIKDYQCIPAQITPPAEETEVIDSEINPNQKTLVNPAPLQA